MKIYLDIDGVILTKSGKEMPYLKEFLVYIFTLSPDNVFWLTTHCKDGSTDMVFRHFQGRLSSDNKELLLKVKPTKWGTLKTEAIDFNDDFLWFDDNVLIVEQNILQTNNKLESWIKVEDNLEDIVRDLRKKFGR